MRARGESRRNEGYMRECMPVRGTPKERHAGGRFLADPYRDAPNLPIMHACSATHPVRRALAFAAAVP